ncbi:MAG: hypothetical protein WDO74_12220 [Pseudomonadota bacterium]
MVTDRVARRQSLRRPSATRFAIREWNPARRELRCWSAIAYG